MANFNIAMNIMARDNASGPIGKITNSLSGLKNRGLSGLQAAGQLAFGGIVAGAGLAVGAVGLIGTAAFGVANDVQTATGEIQAALGTTTEESARLADIAKNVWGNNFAGSISEAAGAVGLVRQQLGDLSDNELQTAAENAFRLADNFDVDVTESISAANTLMENFGLTSDEAFDFIASGFQRGLNRSDDFLDTIGEYSTQFSNGGADAGQFFSLLESGLQGGMLGTDKAADAFKEFRVRIQDGSDGVKGALESIGLNADALYEQMGDGSVTAADAFTMVVDALNEIDDENIRMQAGVGLLGTQFEDLGTAGALGLSLIGTEMEDLAGSTDTLDAKYNNLGSAVEGYKRRALVALEPIGTALLGLANNAMPLVDQAFAFFETSVVPAMETATAVIGDLFTRIAEGESALAVLRDILPPELVTILDWVVTNGPVFLDILIGVGSAFAAMTVIGTVAGWVGSLIAAWGTLTAAITASGSVIGGIVALIGGPVTLVIGAIVAAVGLLAVAWRNNWGDIQGKTQAAVEFIRSIITTVMTAVQTFWETHGETIMTAAETAWQFIQDYIDTALSVIDSVWQAFKSAFEGDWYGFGANLREAAITAWEFIKTTFATAGTAILEWLSGFVLDILAKFNDTDWGEVGTNIIQGIADAILGGIDIIKNAAAAAAQAALDAAKGLLGIESPSKVAALQVGTPFVQGVAQGLENLNPLRGALDGLSSTLVAGALPTGQRAAPALAGSGATIVFQAGSIQIGGSEASGGLVRDLKTAVNQAVNEALAQSGRRADILIRGR